MSLRHPSTDGVDLAGCPRTLALVRSHEEENKLLGPDFMTRGHALRQARELLEHAAVLERELEKLLREGL